MGVTKLFYTEKKLTVVFAKYVLFSKSRVFTYFFRREIVFKLNQNFLLSICNYFFIYLFLQTTFLYALSKKEASIKGLQIMQKVEMQSKIHKTQKSVVELIITNKKGKTRKRHFTLKKKIQKYKDTEESRLLVSFFKPKSVKGMRILVHSKYDGKSEHWIYLPALKSKKQLSSKNSNASFMGSDFTHTDLVTRSLSKDTYYYQKEDEKYYYITSIPNNKGDLYSKLEMKIDKKMLIPIEVRFYDSSAQLVKTLKSKKIEKYSGMYIVTDFIMQNNKSKGYSRILLSSIELGVRIQNSEVEI